MTVQRKDISHQEVSNLFWINALAGTLIALVVCALSPLVSAYYKDPRLTVITCILASNFFFGGLMVQHQALLARVLKLGHSATVRVLASVISTVVAVLLAWKGFGYWALVWREVVRSVLLAAGMWFCFPWIPGLPCWKTDIRGLLGFGAHLSAANILASISGGADRFLLGRFWGAGPVAMYRQAYQLLVVPMDQLLSPVYQVTQPGLSMLQAEALRYRRFYKKVLTVVCVATMPLELVRGRQFGGDYSDCFRQKMARSRAAANDLKLRRIHQAAGRLIRIRFNNPRPFENLPGPDRPSQCYTDSLHGYWGPMGRQRSGSGRRGYHLVADRAEVVL